MEATDGAADAVGDERQCLLDTPTLRVEVTYDRVYVAHVQEFLSLETMAKVLEATWADPNWRQPWGLVLAIGEETKYDRNVRHHVMPSPNRRSVGAAVVSPKQIHRMVVASVGIGMRLANGFHLSAHAELADGIEAQRKIVESMEAAGRAY